MSEIPAEPFNRYGPFAVHSPEWHAHRKLCIGASEVASILGAPGAFQTPLQVWAEKRGIFEEDEEQYKLDKQDWLHFGNVLEPVISDEFEIRSGYPVTKEDQQFISQQFQFLGCSLDRWFWHFEEHQLRSPLDLKNTSIFMKDEWEDMAPLRYQIQVQAQMVVTGCDIGALAVLIGGNRFRWTTIERNQRFIDIMLEKLEQFWEMVKNDVMPEPVAKDNRFIGQLLGGETEGATIVLSTAIVDTDARLVRVKEEIKALTTEKDGLEAKIKKEIGINERGLLPEGGSYSFKTGIRRAYSVAEATSRTLRRLKG